MNARIEDNKLIGVYCIYNKVNGKRYIGESINIYKRIVSHKSNLNRRKVKRANSHFIEDWFAFGADSFDYVVLEHFNFVDKTLLKERELYWMDFHNTCKHEFGYNLRRDASTGMITHEETRRKMSKSQLKRYESMEERRRTGDISKRFWKENPVVKERMRVKLQRINSKYEFHQLDKQTGVLIKVWDSISAIMCANPTYKKHNIYAACSGEKSSIYGYKWCKHLKMV